MCRKEESENIACSVEGLIEWKRERSKVEKCFRRNLEGKKIYCLVQVGIGII